MPIADDSHAEKKLPRPDCEPLQTSCRVGARIFAIDYELGGINALLNRSLARSGVQAAETGWAYIVERANGKLLGATSGARGSQPNLSLDGVRPSSF